jgi:hypothetical protein
VDGSLYSKSLFRVWTWGKAGELGREGGGSWTSNAFQEREYVGSKVGSDVEDVTGRRERGAFLSGEAMFCKRKLGKYKVEGGIERVLLTWYAAVVWDFANW